MAGGTPPAPASAPRVLRAVFGATFFIRFGFGLTLSVFATYLNQAVGVAVPVIIATASIGEFSTVLFSGIAADRYGRIPVLLSGMGVAAAMLVLASLTHSPYALVPIQFAFGVASGAILAASLAVVADQSAADERGLEMGRFDAMNLLGWILGFAVGFGVLGALGAANTGDLAWLLRAGAVVVALGSIAVLVWTRGFVEARARTAFDLSSVREAAFRRDVLLVTLPWLVIYVLLGAFLVYLPTASTGVGFPTTYLAVAIGAGGLALLLTQPYFGRLADRYGRLRLMVVGTFGFLGVLTGATLIVAYGLVPAAIAIIGLSILPALAYGPAALAMLTDLSRSTSRATTMAIYTLSISLGMSIGILGAGELVQFFGTAGLYAYFAAVGAALVVLLWLRYRYVLDIPRPTRS